jgi:hypothetical protein
MMALPYACRPAAGQQVNPYHRPGTPFYTVVVGIMLLGTIGGVIFMTLYYFVPSPLGPGRPSVALRLAACCGPTPPPRPLLGQASPAADDVATAIRGRCERSVSLHQRRDCICCLILLCCSCWCCCSQRLNYNVITGH